MIINSVANSFVRQVNDLVAQELKLKDNVNKDLRLVKNNHDKQHQLAQESIKMVDANTKDPYWINGVNSIASYSKHNYVYPSRID